MAKQKILSVACNSKGTTDKQLDLHILQNKSWFQTFRMTLSCAIFPSWCSVCPLALACLIFPLEWPYFNLFINVLLLSIMLAQLSCIMESLQLSQVHPCPSVLATISEYLHTAHEWRPYPYEQDTRIVSPTSSSSTSTPSTTTSTSTSNSTTISFKFPQWIGDMLAINGASFRLL